MQRLPSVEGTAAGPRRFRWRGTVWRVEAVLEAWREVGEWWQGEAERWFWRVQTWPPALFELAWDTRTQQWWLSRVYD